MFSVPGETPAKGGAVPARVAPGEAGTLRAGLAAVGRPAPGAGAAQRPTTTLRLAVAMVVEAGGLEPSPQPTASYPTTTAIMAAEFEPRTFLVDQEETPHQTKEVPQLSQRQLL